MVAVTQCMRDLRQWLCWRSEERDGKPTKVPRSPLTGEKAKSTDPQTWASYDEAVNAYRVHGHHGIGFVFTPEDGLCGVDLDGCLDPKSGEMEPWAQEAIEELDSYAEISPSGTGVHVLVRGELPEGRNRKGRFEAYDRARYFTVTGKHLSGTPRGIEGRQEELEGVVRRVFGEPSANSHGAPVAAPERADNGISDNEVVQRALAASNGERFARLWDGDTTGHGSHSEADLALCGMLAFWAGPDEARIDGLFRRSRLMRPKWDERHYGDGRTYGQGTIAQALAGRSEFWEPPRRPSRSKARRIRRKETARA